MNQIRQNIQKCRNAINMSPQALADALQVPVETVLKWETGEERADIDMLAKISGILNVDILDILYGEAMEQSSGQRKRKRTYFILFGILTAIMLTLTLWLKPYFAELAQMHFNIWPSFVFTMLAEPLLYIFGSLFLLHGLSLLCDLHVKTWVRNIIFYIGMLLTLAYYIVAFIMILGVELPRPLWFPVYNLTQTPTLFLLPGIALFFGFIPGSTTPRSRGGN